METLTPQIQIEPVTVAGRLTGDLVSSALVAKGLCLPPTPQI